MKDLPKPQKDLPLPEKELTSHSVPASQGLALQSYKWLVLGILATFLLLIFGASIYLLLQNNAGKKLQVCTQEVKQCSDGSYVGRTGPNCELAKCPVPTADPTADWKTFVNNNPSFEIKYPDSPWSSAGFADKDRIIIEYKPGTNSDYDVGEKEAIFADGYEVHISWREDLQADTLEKAANNIYFSDKEKDNKDSKIYGFPSTFSKLELTTLNGLKAFKFEAKNAPTDTTIYVVSYGSKIFKIQLYAMGPTRDRKIYINTAQQILSTLKFAD